MSSLSRRWVIVAGLLGAIGVALGAFGAHALPDQLAALGYGEDEMSRRLDTFATASRYQLLHALVLLSTATLMEAYAARAWRFAAWAFLVGVLIFSGLLYVLTFAGPAYRWLGMVVPIGGALMIAGWVLLAVGAIGSDSGNRP